MLGPSLIASTPWRNRTALRDLAGQLHFIHTTFAEAIQRSTGDAIVLYPLGNGMGEDAWLFALTQQYAAEALALGIAPPADFSDFDVRDEGEFNSFTFILSAETERIRLSAGVV